MDWLDPEALPSHRLPSWGSALYVSTAAGLFRVDNLEQPMLCLSCSCRYTYAEHLPGPESICLEELCPCHSEYWSSLSESVKRRVWGDR